MTKKLAAKDEPRKPSIAAFYARDSTRTGHAPPRSGEAFRKEVERLAIELMSAEHTNEAAVLLEVAGALAGRSAAALRVASMAGLAAPKRRKGGPPSTRTSMANRLRQAVASSRAQGEDDVTIARFLIVMFDCFHAHSPRALALHADESKLAQLASPDAKTFVTAIARELGYERPDNLWNAESKARSVAHAKTKAGKTKPPAH